MDAEILHKFDEVLEPLGNNAALFFLAASLYHAHKISFERAVELSDLSFDDFKARLKEHFDTGFILSNETVLNDINNTDVFIKQ